MECPLMYFHTDDQKVIEFLASVFNTAATTGTRVRLDVDGRGRLRVKRGGGIWSAPIDSDIDPWRDNA